MNSQTASPPAAKPRKRRSRRPMRRALRPARHWFVARGYAIILAICRRMSHRGVLRLGRWLGGMAYRVARRERALAIRNLELAFGRDRSDADRESIARRSFETMTMSILEAMHSTAWDRERLLAAFEFEGEEHPVAALAAGKGAIYATGHFGNWELMSRAILYRSGVSPAVIMRDSPNAALNELIKKGRGIGGIQLYSTDRPAIGYIKMLRRGGVVGVLADQDTKNLSGIHVEFFGRPALTPAGPAFLARKTGAPIVPLFIRRRADDPTRHLFVYREPIYPDPELDEEADVHRMMRAFNALLEDEVRRAPGDWVWIHDRWRHSPKTEGERAGE